MARLLLAGLALFVWGSARDASGAKNTRDPPTINIPGQGPVIGREVAVSRNQKATLYLNIPFAQPPLGHLRFSHPQTDSLPSWEEPRDATQFGPVCMQVLSVLQEQDRILTNFLQDNDLKMSEDCLTLNIFVPDGSAPAEGWPVMLWLHSGDFSTGATSLWDGSVLAVKQKVLVVTAAYRLNILGFFTTLDGNAPGNWGLWDQVAAINWVRGKIGAFIGNPTNLTLFGHGAGGVSVGLHLVSSASGSFQAAIAMSGCAVTPGGVVSDKSQVDAINALAERFDCLKSTPDMIQCMRNVEPVEVLVNEAVRLGVWGPVVDHTFANQSDPFLTGPPLELLELSARDVPLMIGFTDSEDALLLRRDVEKGLSPGLYEEFLMRSAMEDIVQPDPENNETCPITGEQAIDAVNFYYTPQPPTDDPSVLRQKYIEFINDKKYGSKAFLQAAASSKVSPTWLYRFDYRLKTLGVGDVVPDWVNVPHQYELPFVWGMPYWTSLPTQVVWNSQDKKIADIVMSLWSSFAKTKNPTQQIQGGAVKWEPFTDGNPAVMILDRNFSMTDVSTFDYKAFAFWNSYYPKVLGSLEGCCNKTSGAHKLTTFDLRFIKPAGLQLPNLQLPVLLPLLLPSTWSIWSLQPSRS